MTVKLLHVSTFSITFDATDVTSVACANQKGYVAHTTSTQNEVCATNRGFS